MPDPFTEKKTAPMELVSPVPEIEPLNHFLAEENILAAGKLLNALQALDNAVIHIQKTTGASFTQQAWIDLLRAHPLPDDTFSWCEIRRYLNAPMRALDELRSRADPGPAIALTLEKTASRELSVDDLLSVSAFLGPNAKPSIRTVENFTEPDHYGFRKEYYKPHTLQRALKEFLTTANQGYDATEAELIKAVWAMAAFLAIHPLDDGNGRVSRSLFVILLAKARIIDSTSLPIGPLAYLSQGVFEIAARRIMYHRNMDYMLTLLIKGFGSMSHCLQSHYGVSGCS